MNKHEQYKNKIYHGDCLKFMKKVPDNFFDLIFADPSYIPTLTKRMGAIAHLIRFLPYEIYASKGTCKKNKKILIDINSNRYNITIIVAKY